MKARFGARSLLWKVARAILPVALPLLAFGAAAIYVTDAYIGREVATAAARQLDTYRDAVDETIFELDALNLTFSVNTTIVATVDSILGARSLSVDDVRAWNLVNDMLSAQSNARPYISSVYFYLDSQPDRFLSTADGIAHTSSFADSGWIESYRASPPTRVLWTETRSVKRLGADHQPEEFFSLYRRLFPLGQGLKGVIVLNIEKERFDELALRAAMFKGQEVYLLDREGGLILADGSRLPPESLPAAALSEDMASLRQLRYRGQSYYFYSSTTARYDWRVVSAIPASSLKSLPLAVRNLLFLMMCIALALGTAAVLRSAKRSEARLAAVVGLFERADAGLELVERPAPGHDEYDYMIETLIRTFLKERYASLQLSERQARAEVLELRAIRAQMNPHFLFNTLETLYWMVFGKEGQPSQASTMILDLSKLLKYSLEDSEDVALSDEVGQAQRYLAIQAARYAGKFEARWDIEAAAESCKVVKFFLQPLLENAIYHGIRDAEGEGLIEVSARLDEGRGLVLVEVRDNGLGMDGPALSALRACLLEEDHPSDHIGLYNTNRHIKLVFGGEYGLAIESESGSGCLVSVRFPIVRTATSRL